MLFLNEIINITELFVLIIAGSLDVITMILIR